MVKLFRNILPFLIDKHLNICSNVCRKDLKEQNRIQKNFWRFPKCPVRIFQQCDLA